MLMVIKEFMNYKYAYDKMFLSNLRLVASIASNYHSNIDFMDLVNEGNLGLMRAIYGYDVTLGNKFSTYATYWIKFYIRRAAINSYRMIKVPEQVLYDAFKLRDKIMKLENETGKTLSIDEIANELDVSVDVIKECKVIMNEEMSLDQKIGDNEDTELREMIASNYSLEEECFKLVLKDDIEVLLSNLSDREIQVIKMHYGLGEFCDNPISISKISEIFNVSQQRINQIKLSALFKMKRMALRNRKLAAIKEYIK